MANTSPTRWWPLVLVLLAETLFLLFTWWLWEAPVRQGRVTATMLGLLLGFGAAGIWFLFLSRIGWQSRLAGVGLALAGLAGFLGLFRFEGMSGDLVPQFRLRLGGIESVRGADSLAGLRTADYPQFQGPHRNGVLEGIRLDASWQTRPPSLLWKRPVGEGIGGFSVAGGLAITQEQDEQGERIVAYRLASGEFVWEQRTPEKYESPIAGKGPRSNPTIAGGRVFTMGSTGRLTALDLESGSLLWSHNILEERQKPIPRWGKSCSPLVLEDRVIVSIFRTALVAYSVTDGTLLWESGDDGADYASPTVAVLAGRRQILSFNARGPAGYDADNGLLLWEFAWPQGSEQISVPVPVSENRLLVSSGYGVGSKLLELTPAGTGMEVKEIWHTIRLKSKFANYFVIGGHIYGLDDGIMTCLDLATGERVWKRGRYGHGQMIRLDNLILLLAEDGRMVAIEPSPEGLKEVASFQALDGHTWNPPALAGELLLVRNSREAACYRLSLN